MDAFEKWYSETYGVNEDIPEQVHAIFKAATNKAFRAGMRAAALIVADHSPDTNPGSPCNAAVAAVLAEADK